MALIGSIHFQDITRQELQHVSKGMEFVASHSDQLRVVLEDWGRYVMSQQRNIHSSAVGNDTHENKGPLVQLF